MKYSRLNWTKQEQEQLRILKQEINLNSWKKIAEKLHEFFPQKNRTGKQCRQRYMNYVRFGQGTPKNREWSNTQDHLLFQKYLQYGSRWALISTQIEGRSQNDLKNHFYGILRKILRRILKAAKIKKLQPRKILKLDLLINILDESCCYQRISKFQKQTKDSIHQFLKSLARDVLNIGIDSSENESINEVENIISMLSRFMAYLRWHSKNKSSKIQKQDEMEEEMKIQESKIQESTQRVEQTSQKQLEKDLGNSINIKMLNNQQILGRFSNLVEFEHYQLQSPIGFQIKPNDNDSLFNWNEQKFSDSLLF